MDGIALPKGSAHLDQSLPACRIAGRCSVQARSSIAIDNSNNMPAVAVVLSSLGS
jgi:hypothetical protein